MPYADPSSPAAIASAKRGSRKYYYSHREQEISRCAAYNKKHRLKLNAEQNARRVCLPINQVLYNNAKQRSRVKNIEFDLTVDDIAVPEFCPVLGIKLVVGTGCAKPNSPSLDRVDPTKGYTKDNIQVISHKANTIKSNATIAELLAVLSYMRGG